MNFEAAKAWEGQIVDGKFPLRCWLGGSDHSAMFLTEVDGAKAAIKLVAADTLEANLQLLRWQQAAQLLHPHLIRMLTEGRCQLGGAPLLYLVTEYAEENLFEILLQRALTSGETQDLLQSVVDALAYLHGKGFVHGRIQPSNILAQGNQVKVSVDCVRASGQASDRTAGGSVYAAPELHTEALSPAVDVWSLGITMVAALTQRPATSDPTGRKEMEIPAAVPEPFRSIASACLRRDPRQRCTIAEIKSRLKPLPPAAAAPRPIESKPSRLRLLIPVVAILLLAGIFVGPKLLSHHEESSAENSSKTEPRPAVPSQPAVSPPVTNPAKSAPTRTTLKGEVARQVLPTVPQSARNTIQGKVRVGVRVQVDPSGRVSSATLASPGPSKYFAKLALKAAQQWEFTPPRQNGQPAASAWLLRFQFGRTGTQVFPAQERQ
jgi:eukaryotic-like serine/threonine-protein kinase